MTDLLQAAQNQINDAAKQDTPGSADSAPPIPPVPQQPVVDPTQLVETLIKQSDTAASSLVIPPSVDVPPPTPPSVTDLPSDNPKRKGIGKMIAIAVVVLLLVALPGAVFILSQRNEVATRGPGQAQSVYCASPNFCSPSNTACTASGGTVVTGICTGVTVCCRGPLQPCAATPGASCYQNGVCSNNCGACQYGYITPSNDVYVCNPAPTVTITRTPTPTLCSATPGGTCYQSGVCANNCGACQYGYITPSNDAYVCNPAPTVSLCAATPGGTCYQRGVCANNCGACQFGFLTPSNDAFICNPSPTPTPGANTCTTVGATNCQKRSDGSNTGYKCTCLSTRVWNCTTQDTGMCPTNNPGGGSDANIKVTSGCPAGVTMTGRCINNIPGTSIAQRFTCPGVTLASLAGKACATNPENLTGSSSICFKDNFCGVQQIDVDHNCFMSVEDQCNPTSTPSRTPTSPPITQPPQSTNTPTRPPNSPTLTNTPIPGPQCVNIRVYKSDGTDVTATLLAGTSGVKPGDTITFGVSGQNVSKARFRINCTTASCWQETTTQNSRGEYVVQFTIPALSASTAFTVESEVFGLNGQWK